MVLCLPSNSKTSQIGQVVILDEMRSCTSTTVGSISGGALEHRIGVLPTQPSTSLTVIFPLDMLIERFKITGILERETAGYYPRVLLDA